MFLLHNLLFFDKHGNAINPDIEYKIKVDVIDDEGDGCDIIAVTNDVGKLIGCSIKNGGAGYINPIIIFTDKITNTKYTVLTKDILVSNGVISNVTLRQKPVGFSFPYLTYNASLFFEEVSENLIETEHIFILEKAKTTDGEEIFIRPRSTQGDYISTSKNTSDDNITIFTVDYSTLTPEIIKTEFADTLFDDGSADSFLNMDRITSKPLTVDSMQFNYMTTGFLDHIFEGIFNISYNTHVIFSLSLRSESKFEDERFKKQLENFGIVIGNEEEKIFRDSDISESLPNYTLLNEKRKEMLLSNTEIFPYIGSYKAIVNMIKYFGYADMRIKEYWLNVSESKGSSKWKMVDVPNMSQNYDNKINQSQLIPSENYKKTTYFGLFYDVNKTTGTFDEYGIPEVEDSFEFTLEEVLIKLMSEG